MASNNKTPSRASLTSRQYGENTSPQYGEKKNIDKQTNDTIRKVVELINSNETEKGKKLYEFLKEGVIGQDEACKALVECIIKSSYAVGEREKPLGVYYFSGPTGVGKTEIVKRLAKFFFGNSNSYTHISGETLTNQHESSRLKGAPPGYTGYNNTPILSSKSVLKKLENNSIIKHNNFGIILFDEADKIHPQIIQELLQLIGEGRFQTNDGNIQDLKNTIIIFTSNLGQHEIEISKRHPIGFSNINNDENPNDNEILKNIFEEYFSPEFKGRIHQMIHFKKFDENTKLKIIEKAFSEYRNDLNALNIHQIGGKDIIVNDNDFNINFDKSIKDYFLKEGFNNDRGAREFKIKFENFQSQILYSIDNDENICIPEGKSENYSHKIDLWIFFDEIDQKIKIDTNIQVIEDYTIYDGDITNNEDNNKYELQKSIMLDNIGKYLESILLNIGENKDIQIYKDGSIIIKKNISFNSLLLLYILSLSNNYNVISLEDGRICFTIKK